MDFLMPWLTRKLRVYKNEYSNWQFHGSSALEVFIFISALIWISFWRIWAVMQVWKCKQCMVFHGGVIRFMHAALEASTLILFSAGRKVRVRLWELYSLYIWISFSTRMKRVSISQNLSSEHDFECRSCWSWLLLHPICETYLHINDYKLV